ncbi:nicotinamidase/pyrazinamidase [Clostridiales bacterium CHKCI001]|nr:nicotinamidase/pyrazinamidase [Clostridiales bacterium CHKCI001]
MKKALVIIDMQNDFINGALGTKEAQAIVGSVKKKIEQALKAGNDVIFTQDTHYDTYLETAEGKKLPVQHCIYGTNGWEICPELKEYSENAEVFEKPTFGSVKLARYLAVREYEAVEFVGLCTDICVISNVLLVKAVMPESELLVDASCCAGVTPESHKNALEAMKMCQVNIIGN